MKKNTLLISLCTLFIYNLICLSSVSAWSTHYLVSERNFNQPGLQFLEKKINVESLESFLNTRHTELKTFFKDFETWLRNRNPERNKNIKTILKDSSVEGFLRASRLYPKQKFFQVRRLYLHENIKNADFDGDQLGRYVPQFRRKKYFKKTPELIKAKDILATYSDEPDWGFDNDLFQYPEYQYGKAPYGISHGIGSQGLFHTYYVHENFLVNYFAPALGQSLMPERVALFIGLSTLAKEHGHEYWAYRFLAWALHYLQDIAQPYHSRAAPFANLYHYADYAFSFGIFGMNKKEKAHSTALMMANRHYAIESFTTYCLKRQDGKSLHWRLPFATNFLGRQLTFDTTDPFKLFYETGKIAAENASALDDKIAENFPPRISDNGKKNNYYDKTYNFEAILSVISSDKLTDMWFTTSSFLHLSDVSARHLVLLQFAPEKLKLKN